MSKVKNSMSNDQTQKVQWIADVIPQLRAVAPFGFWFLGLGISLVIGAWTFQAA